MITRHHLTGEWTSFGVGSCVLVVRSREPGKHTCFYLGDHLTLYAIRRDHGTETGPFIINVACRDGRREHGFGFQLYVRGVCYGVSVHRGINRLSISN
jgi:regulator of RNase E activity RraA